MAILTNLGDSYQQLGDIRSALRYGAQVLDISRKLGNQQGEGAALTNIGAIYSILGDDRLAIQYLEQSLAIKPRSEIVTHWLSASTT